MNQFFEKYPWLRTMLCGLMAAALLLSVLLPVLRLQRQEPENPIREENIQPVEPLSFGEAEGTGADGRRARRRTDAARER